MSASPRPVADESPAASTSASSPTGPSSAAVSDMLNELLRRTHLGPSELPLRGPSPVVAEESLVPGDLLLLYTDGLTFTVLGPGEFIEREASAEQTAPERLRRLRHAIERQPGQLRDDATVVLVEWRRGAVADLLPQTAPY
jgi:hypothetical protein